MKKLFLLALVAIFFVSCNNASQENASKNESTTLAPEPAKPIVKPVYLTEEMFKSKVFDFTSGQKFKYLGDKPCVIDFYADWCRPCKQLAPIMDELATDYKDKVYFYKVNTDDSQLLARYFNIEGIPAVFLIPMKGEPQNMVGLNPKQTYAEAINGLLSEVNSK